jgi:signal transduction histidine kinase
LVFQCLLSLVHFGVNKQREFLLYSLNVFLLSINFSVNFYFWLQPTPAESAASYVQLFFGLPVNYFLYIVYCLFIKEYLQLGVFKRQLEKKIDTVIYINLLLGIGSAISLYFFPQWHFGFKHLLMLLTFCIIVYPLFLLRKTKVRYSHLIIRGSSFIVIGILMNILFSFLGYGIEYTDSMIIGGTFIEVMFFNYALQFKMKDQEQQLLRTEIEKQKAIKNEYKRVAADLHDEVGSTLSSIHIISVVSQKKMATDIPESKRLLQLITDQAKKMQHNLSDIVWGLSTDLDSVDDLAIKLREILEHTFGAVGVAYQIENIGGVSDIKLSVMQRRNLILIFKEAINNILKYARATKTQVSFAQQNDALTMQIEDDGVGFNMELTSKTSNGLNNMARRTEQLGGHFSLQSIVNKGTTLIIIIPLHSPDNLQVDGF